MTEDYSNSGREDYTTTAGRLLQRKYFYYSPAEWGFLYQLSKESDMSLGKLLITLAYEERERQQSFHFLKGVTA